MLTIEQLQKNPSFKRLKETLGKRINSIETFYSNPESYGYILHFEDGTQIFLGSDFTILEPSAVEISNDRWDR